MARPKLSILICSLQRRKLFLDRLMQCIQPQLAGNDGVEMLTEIDNGEISIGAKRNALLQKATGDYVAFVDDDDLVADDYVSSILSAIESSPDVIGFPILVSTDGTYVEYGFISSVFHSWFDLPDPFKSGRLSFFACANHITPVRRDLALRVGFPSRQKKEDLSFSFRLREHLSSEVYLDAPMYYYLRRTNCASSEQDVFPSGGGLEALQNELRSLSMDDMQRRLQLGINSSRNCPVKETAYLYES